MSSPVIVAKFSGYSVFKVPEIYQDFPISHFDVCWDTLYIYDGPKDKNPKTLCEIKSSCSAEDTIDWKRPDGDLVFDETKSWPIEDHPDTSYIGSIVDCPEARKIEAIGLQELEDSDSESVDSSCDDYECEICNDKDVCEDNYVGCCSDGACPHNVEHLCSSCASWNDEKSQWICNKCISKA